MATTVEDLKSAMYSLGIVEEFVNAIGAKIPVDKQSADEVKYAQELSDALTIIEKAITRAFNEHVETQNKILGLKNILVTM